MKGVSAEGRKKLSQMLKRVQHDNRVWFSFLSTRTCFGVLVLRIWVLKPRPVGGVIYFSVPIGVERVEFNAHRVFAPQTIMEQFQDLSLLSFSVVDDEGRFHEQSRPEDNAEAHCACGLFEFGKLDNPCEAHNKFPGISSD